MKKDKIKEKFLTELERTPIIQHACEKLGVSRNTFYRWLKEDSIFAFQVKDALDAGIDYVNDHAESNVLGGIKNGDQGYTKYWLSSRHEAYRRPFLFRGKEEMTREDRELQVKKFEESIQREQDKWFEN
jgi:hypothetical protein